MADFEEKMPSGLWGTIVFLFIEIILIVCLVPNCIYRQIDPERAGVG